MEGNIKQDKLFQNWIKCSHALKLLQSPLERFIGVELEKFHQVLLRECGMGRCVKKCQFTKWKPGSSKIPPLDCQVCSCWRDEILAYHTNPRGKVMWKNSKPHLWSQEIVEVAKVYMPDGHENHKSLSDFDIAALLCLMIQCKYFKKFEIGALCERVLCVRNKVMHCPRFDMKREDLHDYLNHIKDLGKKLEYHDEGFKILSEETETVAQDASGCNLPRMMLEKLKTKLQKEKELLVPVRKALGHLRAQATSIKKLLGRNCVFGFLNTCSKPQDNA
ncbi:uncharacterized protein CXorf38 homolog isoform X2 [Lates calcarifer]|uniref:Uncharacterized protein CXorf38 homolog isoform X2 n=1 Tax=Lates calcarifer TaxID=8187 RepID=A0A4W6C3E3_LATCA|nr:uncharacterized protein CXorf38 homolog isoform X2 [Lates calcarifer]